MMNVSRNLVFVFLLTFLVVNLLLLFVSQNTTTSHDSSSSPEKFSKLSINNEDDQSRIKQLWQIISLNKEYEESAIDDQMMFMIKRKAFLTNKAVNGIKPVLNPKAMDDMILNQYTEPEETFLNSHPNKDQHLKWMDRAGLNEFAGYGGDGSCSITNKNREPWRKILSKWIEIAKVFRIRYFLSAGTLLGAWRDEEAMPYAQDLGIRIHIDDFDKLNEMSMTERRIVWDPRDDHKFHIYFSRDWRLPLAERRRFSCEGKRVYEYEGQCSFSYPNARLIFRDWHLDIYAYNSTSGHQQDQTPVRFMPYDVTFEFRKVDIFPVTRCMFMGMETRCPQNPLAVFKTLYEKSKNDYLNPERICTNKTWVKTE